MTDREKLLDIFKNIEYTPFPEMGTKANLANQFTDYALNSIVDEMIKRGVIAPPCNVGDTVYFVYGGLINPHKIKRFEMTEYGNFAFSSIMFTFEEFGKTVFLTREEAKQALAEIKKGKEYKNAD